MKEVIYLLGWTISGILSILLLTCTTPDPNQKATVFVTSMIAFLLGGGFMMVAIALYGISTHKESNREDLLTIGDDGELVSLDEIHAQKGEER